MRHREASTIYFWIATLSLSLSSARSCKVSTMSSLHRVVTTTLCDPRDRLPGIGKTVEEEHKGALLPKQTGGCMSLQGNEVILASRNTPSCRRGPSLGTGNLFQTCPSQAPSIIKVSWAVQMCGPGPALPGEGCALLRGNGSNQISLCLFSL